MKRLNKWECVWSQTFFHFHTLSFCLFLSSSNHSLLQLFQKKIQAKFAPSLSKMSSWYLEAFVPRAKKNKKQKNNTSSGRRWHCMFSVDSRNRTGDVPYTHIIYRSRPPCTRTCIQIHIHSLSHKHTLVSKPLLNMRDDCSFPLRKLCCFSTSCSSIVLRSLGRDW